MEGEGKVHRNEKHWAYNIGSSSLGSTLQSQEEVRGQSKQQA